MKKNGISVCLALLLIGLHPSKVVAVETAVLSLPEAIQIAVKNNPLGRQAVEYITGAQYAKASAKAGYLPNVSAQYSVTQMADHIYQVQNGQDVQVAHDTQWGWGVALVQPLFTGFAVSSQYEITKLGVEISEKKKEQSFLDIILAVKNSYYGMLLSQKIQMVAGEALTTLDSHEKDAQRFYNHGIIRLNDLLRAKVARSEAVQQQERAGADVDIARANLNRWLALDINADTSIEPIDTIRLVHASLPELIEKGLKQQPQLQAMALTNKTLDKAIDLEKSTYYPTVSLVGSYWHNGDTPIADNNDYENDHNASVTLQASWSLFDGFKTESKVGKAISAKRAFQYTIRQAEDQTKVEVKSAWLDLGVAQHNVETFRIALSQAEENMRITQLAYRQEAATSTEVLDARTDLSGAKTNYYQALYGYLKALAALEHAVGGEIVVESEPVLDKSTRKEVTHE
jgi:outer membrane protein TolC